MTPCPALIRSLSPRCLCISGGARSLPILHLFLHKFNQPQHQSILSHSPDTNSPTILVPESPISNSEPHSHLSRHGACAHSSISCLILQLQCSTSRIPRRRRRASARRESLEANSKQMKKVQVQSPVPRSRSRTAPSSSSSSSSNTNNAGADDPSLNLRSLDRTLPHPSSFRRSGPPPGVSSRRASLDPQASSPGVATTSRRASLDQQVLRKPLSKQSTVSSAAKQSSRKQDENRLAKVSSTKSNEVKRNGKDDEESNLAAGLPMDSLYLCLEKLQSVYHVVTCASVCRHWREAVHSDVVWKALYVRWWHPDEENVALIKLPPGFATWRETFISKYSQGKRKIQSQVITHGVNAGWLRTRRMLDRRGKQVRDCMPGDTMRKIVEQLGLTFHVQINRDAPIRLRGKASVVYFPGSCLLRYPTKTTKTGLSLRSLKSFKVTATSDRLLRTCTVASFDTHTDRQWEMVSREGQNAGPLRLLQQAPKQNTSWIVGTLFEGMHGIDSFSMEEHGQEQVILLMASLHLSDLVWLLLELGDGASPHSSRRLYHDHMNPSYGLYNWRASIQLHTFGKLLFGQEFDQVFWSPRESTPGQVAVFLLIASHEVFPGVLTSPWRTEVFSGELRGVVMLDVTLWDPAMEIAWRCTRAVRTSPAELATVEYGPPGLDGERVHTGVQDEKQGVSVSMNLCTPFTDGWGATHEVEPTVVITDLRFALTPKFLMSWFGRSNL